LQLVRIFKNGIKFTIALIFPLSFSNFVTHFNGIPDLTVQNKIYESKNLIDNLIIKIKVYN